MKFRVWTNDSSCVDRFSNVIQMISGLAKNCVLRITKDGLFFIIREKSVQGGAEAWCEVEQASMFSECICEGFSVEEDQILLEVVPEQLLHCLKSGTVFGNTFSGSISSLGASTATVNVAGNSIKTTPFTSGVMTRSLKVKLVRRKTPCLALEVEQASITGRSRAVWHFVPVHILPLRLWSDFKDHVDPDFDLSIFLPPVKSLRLFVDRMKRFARFITLRANGKGDLYLEINMEMLARVCLTFHGLRARNWHNEAEPECKTNNGFALESGGDVESSNFNHFSATIDVRRFGQLLSSQRVQPNWFVCNIVQDHLIQFVLLFDNYRLKYTLPASRF